MRNLPTFRRNALWIGFSAALLALGVLLFLQYRWLRQLDSASSRAHRNALLNHVDAISREVRYFYRSSGERALNLPYTVFTQNHLDRAVHYLTSKCSLGARRLFVVSFVGAAPSEPLLIDPIRREVVPATVIETRAIEVATAPWRTLAERHTPVDRLELTADERDRAQRMLLNPITDESSQIVGLAGMILDDKVFLERVLPAAVQRALPRAVVAGQRHDPMVALLDRAGHILWSADDASAGGTWEIQRPLSFAFTDCRIAARSRHGPPVQWAARNFRVNLGLSLALSASMLCGLLVAFSAAAKEMALSRLKSDFVSNVSHELRTPLASIRVFGEFLRLGRVDTAEKVREYGVYIEAESRRLTHLIHNLLDFASIEAGHKTYRLTANDLASAVEETLSTFEVRLRQAGFTLRYDPPSTPLPSLPLDRDAFILALSNLLDNAIKYSGDCREIEVSLGSQGKEAVLEVRDRGVGIPRNEQGRIFDRFHRVSTGLVHEVRGSGLGLAIVHHIVHAHGGKVTVDSRPGEGSTFAIHLPLPREAPLAPPAEERPIVPPAPAPHSYGTS